MYPSYLNLTTREFDKRIEDAYKLLEKCSLCYRKCGVNRLKGELGFCKSGLELKVSSYNLHSGEELPISGSHGSGTIFFTGCSLSCVFCQNYPISQLGVGNMISIDRLAEMMIELQLQGAHNINLVTPTHFVPQILSALKVARAKRLKLPIVYNTGGYDELKTLKLLNGIVDIYMPDAKYGNNEQATKYSNSPNYVDANHAALQEMYSQTGDLVLDNGIAKSGMLVRVLILPANINDSEKVLEFLHSISRDMYVSLMSQYFPANKAFEYPELSRRITYTEYEKAYNKLRELGLQGYTQSVNFIKSD